MIKQPLIKQPLSKFNFSLKFSAKSLHRNWYGSLKYITGMRLSGSNSTSLNDKLEYIGKLVSK